MQALTLVAAVSFMFAAAPAHAAWCGAEVLYNTTTTCYAGKTITTYHYYQTCYNDDGTESTRYWTVQRSSTGCMIEP